ncbi:MULTISPECIES: DUF1090 domain-containing protein [Achromobacter]|uniref:Protein YqjC n=1 Tax=Achromobacter dolens TaxID=1287738 RepID=A0A6S7E5Y5_9BURK|nr:DUF1090 domain-containing protein [Achromobacter dolens]MBQ2646274.1 DUF1090 domain-containing protein [Achromobacter sp.]OAS96382.1 hypothetical protein A6I77_21375 [Achromobacter xylosoxidans]CAB3703272.1 hypothetical protein LMG26840_05435 [Achromobacter dolens]CAB3880181.1 hypothetical protein LMG26842_04318 [Achromobacter dolens]CAB3897661.1 hypothetical protein LMG26841_04309 [Achromobacter dolens]
MSALTKTLLAATAASALSGLLPAYAYDHAECSAQRGCAAKICHLERELSYARAHNNSHRVAGLQRALAETKAHCTDSRLEAEREADVRDKQAKVAEREDELKAARAKGKEEKILKAQRKLDEARAEYDAALADLNR